MNQHLVVRRADESDASSLLTLRKRLFEETEFMLWEPGEFRDTPDDERQRIARLNGQHNAACFVAESGGELVGFLNAMGAKINRLRHSTTLALGVLRSHWGLGVASALLAHALAWAREERLVRVELTVHTTNERAVGLYRRAGFEIEGVRRRSLLVSDRYVDEYLMSILLNET
jgi:RimJ/RimL family protein N-acetyltransferase